MKTKREVFQHIAKYKGCYTSCYDCPYSKKNTGKDTCIVRKLMSIGAMAILRQNRKKREFDPDKILTCITADKAKVGMNGHFADCLADIKSQFNTKHIRTLSEIRDEGAYERFIDQAGTSWALFYLIDEVEE